MFQGPNAYITPAWYATKHDSGEVVPTWNYVVVQAHGRLRAIDDPAWVRALLDELTARHESPRPAPWSVDDAPADYIHALLRAIVGIEMPVARIAGKWKLSQNQPAANRAGVVAGLGESSDAAMAALVRDDGPPGSG